MFCPIRGFANAYCDNSVDPSVFFPTLNQVNKGIRVRGRDKAAYSAVKLITLLTHNPAIPSWEQTVTVTSTLKSKGFRSLPLCQ